MVLLQPGKEKSLLEGRSQNPWLSQNTSNVFLSSHHRKLGWEPKTSVWCVPLPAPLFKVSFTASWGGFCEFRHRQRDEHNSMKFGNSTGLKLQVWGTVWTGKLLRQPCSWGSSAPPPVLCLFATLNLQDGLVESLLNSQQGSAGEIGVQFHKA